MLCTPFTSSLLTARPYLTDKYFPSVKSNIPPPSSSLLPISRFKSPIEIEMAEYVRKLNAKSRGEVEPDPQGDFSGDPNAAPVESSRVTFAPSDKMRPPRVMSDDVSIANSRCVRFVFFIMFSYSFLYVLL